MNRAFKSLRAFANTENGQEVNNHNKKWKNREMGERMVNFAICRTISKFACENFHEKTQVWETDPLSLNSTCRDKVYLNHFFKQMSWAFLFSSNMLIVGCDFKSSVTEVIWKSKQKIYHWHYFAEMQLNFEQYSRFYREIETTNVWKFANVSNESQEMLMWTNFRVLWSFILQIHHGNLNHKV